MTVGKVAEKTNGWCVWGQSAFLLTLWDQAYGWAFNLFVLGPDHFDFCLKISLLFQLMRAGTELSRVWELESCEVLGFICNFNQGSLNWAFVFLFNFYPCNLNLISVLKSPSSPTPQFLIPLLSSDFPPKSRVWHLNPSFRKCLKCTIYREWLLFSRLLRKMKQRF